MISKRTFFFVLCFLSLIFFVFIARTVKELVVKRTNIIRNPNGIDLNTPHIREEIQQNGFGERGIRETATKLDGQSSQNKNDSTLHIVLYAFYYITLKGQAKAVDMSKCSEYKNCVVRYQNKRSKKPFDADAIVFQGNRMPRDLPRRLNTNQVFVYINIESPQYLQVVKLTDNRLQEFFNWTMSYRLDSDIPYLYGSIIPRTLSNYDIYHKSEMTGKHYNYRDFLNLTKQWPNRHDGIEDKNYEAIFQEKTKSSVWFVSHCNTASKREKYVIEMKKLTNVDIFGACSPTKNICPKSQKNCIGDIEIVYKFVLAFENSLCEDYVTEKVYDRFDMDIITVVFGAHNYSRYLPKGTYIDANDFATPADLVEYMNYVGSNKDVYLDYLRLKDQYKAIKENDHVQLAYCTLCYRLNKLNEYNKQAGSLARWWNGPGVCNNPTRLYSKRKKRGKVSKIHVPK